ncbi:hypothetical protein ACFLSJ_07125, partial [Verrucomicrobiota bacterium]
TGEDISHWDEVTRGNEGDSDSAPSGSGGAGRAVVVHFTRQVLGTRTVNLVIARTEKGVEGELVVPRVVVEGSLKHTGTLVVSGERGVRMTTVEREGVSEMNPRDIGVRQAGVLAFKLLRPEWLVRLEAKVVEPTLRAEVLQRVDVSEGMLQCAAYARYRIDHAGCRTLRLQAPEPGVGLAVTGPDIAKVHEIDAEHGIWEVELHNKAESRYRMEIRYQVPFAAQNGKAGILPLRCLDVESQKGYVVVMSGGRVQVSPVGPGAGVKRDNARSIPAHFGAGDLSDAILCYRTVSGDYRLDLSVLRHETADSLPATVESVRLQSVVSADGEYLTQAEMDLTVGSLPFLEMRLPGEDASLWAAFVNGKAAAVSRVGDTYRIPLEEPVPGESTSVEFVYADRIQAGWLSRKQACRGPMFDLPLKDIEWVLFVVPGRRYYGFGGSMEHEKESAKIGAFNVERYEILNRRQVETDRARAKSVMEQSGELARRGYQKQARKALEAAVNYSQNDAAFNEDARIQYKNLAEQQAVVGFVQRRDEMRLSQNIQDSRQIERMNAFQGGRFTAEHAESVQQSLAEGDNLSLLRIAGRILGQQEAAQRVAQAIRVTLPTHGLRLRFTRALQISPGADMLVTFKVGSGGFLRGSAVLGAALAFLVIMLLALRSRGRIPD